MLLALAHHLWSWFNPGWCKMVNKNFSEMKYADGIILFEYLDNA